MIRWRSIKAGLTSVFVLFLVQVSILGAFAIQELGAVDRDSAEIRERWLPGTRVLGDLNNYTSDARAAEASRLLARTPAQTGAADRELDTLARRIAHARDDYQKIPHGAEEIRLYRRFAAAWSDYQDAAGQVLALSRAGRRADGADLYMSASRRAYAVASDDLGLLNNLTMVRAAQASARASVTYRTARAVIALVIALAAISLMVAVRYISRVISGPLLGLATRMRSLAVGDTSVDVEGADRPDEIGEMARALAVFRANAIDLAHSRRGLVQQAAMLAEKLEAEQRLTVLQRNFVSMASHEFRTPLTVIDAHAQRLATLKDRLSPGDIAERAGRIRGSVKGMTQLMERLLNTARLFDGDPALYFHPTSINPAELLAQVCHLHREIAAGAWIVEHLRGLPPLMTGDPNLLLQAFGNLLSNAVKYSPDGGRIDLAAAADGPWLVVTVADQGLGIPAADRDRVFDRYHRGANVSGIVGTGVGLYLVKMIVELHRGQITVESHEGHGSRFVVRLPMPPRGAGR